MSSAQKRKRPAQPVRKGFKVNAEAKAAIVEYEDSDEEVSQPPKANKSNTAESVAPAAAATTANLPPAAVTAGSRRGAHAATAGGLAAVSAASSSTAAGAAAAPSAMEHEEDTDDKDTLSREAAGGASRKAFHYPLGGMGERGAASSSSAAANANIKVASYLSTTSKMSHHDRLIAALEDIVGREISTLQEYFQQESDAKPEFLAAMKSTLNDTMDEVRSDCPADVSFLPEFKDSKERRREGDLEAERAALTAKVSEVEVYLGDMAAFGQKFGLTTDAEEVKRASEQAVSASGESSATKQHDVAASKFRSILTGINAQCDSLLNDYVDTEVKNTLAYAQHAQQGLYNAYQKVRAANTNGGSTSGGCSSSSGSTGAAAAGALSVVGYANMLQSQTLVNRPLKEVPQQSSSANSNASKNSTNTNTNNNNKGAAAAAKATPKKLLRGFGKT